MNWLFAIVSLTDFDAEYGPLLVSPGSHTATYGVAPRARGKRAKSGASGSNLPRRVRRQAG